MSQMIYGVFDTRAQADSAILAVQSETRDDIHALVHEGRLRDEDVQVAATDALRGAILGAILVGGLAALIGALLVPSGTLSFGWSEFFFMAIAGTTLGVTAGAVAGASEPRQELMALAKRLQEGKVLVTMNAHADVPTSTIVELFAENGAIQVEAA
jgi:hypothetical protein